MGSTSFAPPCGVQDSSSPVNRRPGVAHTPRAVNPASAALARPVGVPGTGISYTSHQSAPYFGDFESTPPLAQRRGTDCRRDRHSNDPTPGGLADPERRANKDFSRLMRVAYMKEHQLKLHEIPAIAVATYVEQLTGSDNKTSHLLTPGRLCQPFFAAISFSWNKIAGIYPSSGAYSAALCRHGWT
jgi:hypothetical protein